MRGALRTIGRGGRRDKGLEAGRALGSFEQWCGWVRDPLLALGCKDPADRVSEAKARDGRRQAIAELFAIWWERHGDWSLTTLREKLVNLLRGLSALPAPPLKYERTRP